MIISMLSAIRRKQARTKLPPRAKPAKCVEAAKRINLEVNALLDDASLLDRLKRSIRAPLRGGQVFAVLFQPHTSLPLGLFAVLCVFALGFALIVRAVEQRYSRRATLIVGLCLVAAYVLLLCAPSLYAVICGACIGCDPWWLEWFWICVPAA